ncbi:Protein of unknown function [Humidesulfovibrio mexicanus]|uniref:DUF2992 family protein n=1 Tax=Humidesulfovibrio mexicanus TaxID=147047 RepID=A0A238XQ52_9BACT|nr:Protein of unknown function [Humidesulfovibrio mexicanus]
METVTVRLLILFEAGFWVGYFERECAGECSAARHVFGQEPGIAELGAFVQGTGYGRLLWARAEQGSIGPQPKLSPKRRLREIARTLRDVCAVSKARQSVQAEREARKIERLSARSARREALRDERFVERCERRKRKRRGH